MADFKTWFTNAGGSLNHSVGITEFPGMGQGAIAIDAIPVSTLKNRIASFLAHLTLLKCF